MTSQLIITLAVLAFMIIMFVWQKFPMGCSGARSLANRARSVSNITPA